MNNETTQPDRCEQIAREKYYQTGDHRSRILKHENQQPKSEPSRESREIAKDLIEPYVLPYYGPEESKLEDRVVKALQAKQDELDALREEVLGVIEPFALHSTRNHSDEHPDEEILSGGYSDKHGDVSLKMGHCRAALALRDKLKASQPTLPQPQTPHQ